MKTKAFMYLIIFLTSVLTIGASRNESRQEDWVITIKRSSYNSKSVTGELFVNGTFVCHTLELPWQSNKSFISSIPSGEYSAFLRYDKKDKWRLKLEGVPQRSGVQIHIGNYPSQIQGCVLVGERVINRENRLESSRKAYELLKNAFYGSANPNSTPDVSIKVKIEYNIDRTKLIRDDGFSWEHAKEDLWFSGSNNTKNHELKRDLKYIYIKSGGIFPVYYRFPLHGGELESRFNKNKPWEKSGANYRREN